jgi:dihydroxy-acid dehydratase
LVNRIDSPELDVDKDSVLVMQNAGPKGAPGMPESGYLPIPKKLLKAGIKDMVRISDARMSGTAFGTIVLHIAPESAVGGPLALVQDGDMIKLDVANRSLELLVSDDELNKRRGNWSPPPPHPGSERGYSKLYQDTVTQAPEGADFDFLKGGT